MTFNFYPSSILLTFTSHFSSVVNNNNNNNNFKKMFVEWGELALLQKLMACAILNDYMVCPAQENEAVALSNNS